MISEHTFRLDGRLALVTGSSAGIGLALARGLGQAGATLVLNGRDATRLGTAAEQLRAEGLTVHLSPFDVCDAQRVAAAVDAIERFLVPFECWSMIEYGLYGDDENQRPRMSRINTGEKAASFLQLLDRTIPTSGTASIPNDLSSALQQIRTVAPRLAGTPSYRRLATAARF